MEYKDRVKFHSQRVCRKVFGVGTNSNEERAHRLRRLMAEAVRKKDKELVHVACDIAADDVANDTALLAELDARLKEVFY